MKNILNFIMLALTLLNIQKFTAQINILNKKEIVPFGILDAPVWKGNEYLYFSDVRRKKMLRYSIVNKDFEVVFRNEKRMHGMMLNEKGNLLVCENGKAKITERKKDGELIRTRISKYKGKPFNGINDLCVDKKGGIYFTDSHREFINQSQLTSGVYYLNSKGIVIKLISDMSEPNGVLVSKTGKKLYISDADDERIRVYNINENGTIAKQNVFCRLQFIPPKQGENKIGANGMATDSKGNLYVATKLGLQIFDKKGKLLELIEFPKPITNCTFGGIDKKTLFVTGKHNLYSVVFRDVKGIQHPFDLPKK